MVYLILGAGFEESEAIVPCDLLRRAGVEVRLAGIGGTEITGSHGVTVRADCVAEQTALEEAEMLILPGGLRGVASIRACRPVLDAVRQVAERGGWVAAICAAPTVLAQLGITDGRRATCYPSMEPEMGSAVMSGEQTAQDGRIITGQAAGASIAFGLKLVEALRGEAAAQQVAAGIVAR